MFWGPELISEYREGSHPVLSTPELWGLKGTCAAPPFQLPPSSSPQQLHTQHPGRFGSLHRRRLPHLSGQLCQGSATLTAHSSSSRSHRTPWAPICARCPLSWRWAPPNTARPPPPHPQPFRYPPALLRPPSAFSPSHAQPWALILSSSERCSRPLIVFVAFHAIPQKSSHISGSENFLWGLRPTLQ